MNAPASCPACRGTDIQAGEPYRGQHPVFQRRSLHHCRSCGLGFAHPMPGEHELEEYNASYFHSAHGGRARGRVAEAFFSAMARLRAQHAKRYLEQEKIEVGTVLELGPGGGHFAAHWLQTFPGVRYLALETDTSCHAELKKLGVELLDPSSDILPPCDLVVMSHVLEHVPDPQAFLRRCTASMRSGGALFIEVPCRDWEYKAQDEPHVLFFDKAPMRQLLQSCGFDDVRVTYHGAPIRSGRWRWRWQSLRERLLARGLVAPFAGLKPGMEVLSDPLERAAVAPFDAHRESSIPAWWLRALAIKL